MPFYTDPITNTELKFACSHCIKGHRSTNCAHNDRALFYIRKKGRPVSQCTHCRSLRKQRALHTRCECPSRVQNRGLGITSDSVPDLPEGMMKLEAVKEFVARLHNDLGCRNCNSPRCQCEERTIQNIAPASPSPVTSISTEPSSYSVGYPSNFTSVAPPQMRSVMYGGPAQYSPMPQFTEMPNFANSPYFQPSANQSLTSNAGPNIASQVQAFQRRQEALRATTQRRIEEELIFNRRNHENIVGSLQQNSPGQPPESYHQQRASFAAANLASSLDTNDLHTASQRFDLSQQAYPNRGDSNHEPIYNFMHDPTSSTDHVSYATSLQNSIYRYPSSVEMQPRGASISHLSTNVAQMDPHNRKSSYITESGMKPHESSTTSNSDLSLQQYQPKPVSGQEDRHDNAVVAFATQHDDLEVEKGDSSELVEGVEHEEFQGLDKVFDWDPSDNEWLYSLQTECAKPGAVCECGDSCCCPGCFTHTNNEGDRRVLNSVIGKMSSILEPEKDELESAHNTPSQNTPCVPNGSQSSTSNADTKL